MPAKSLRQRVSELTTAVRASSKTVDTHRIQTKISTWIIMACSLIGGFIALQTYRLDVSKDVDQSVAKVFDMIMLHNGAEYDQSRRHVRSYVIAKRECDARIMSRDLTDDDYVRMVELYDVVLACVEAKLCDSETSYAFFSRHANYDWPILDGVVENLRNAYPALKADKGFGRGYAALATAPITAPLCEGNF